MGVAMEVLARSATLSAEVRLLLTTGFLGGLTTFSTFSAEVTSMLLRRDFYWALVTIGAHVVGSLAMTLLGILIVRALLALTSA